MVINICRYGTVYIFRLLQKNYRLLPDYYRDYYKGLLHTIPQLKLPRDQSKMHPPAVTALLLAAFVAASTFNLLASASRSGGFSEINVNSIRVQNAARQAVALLNADAPRCRAHNLTVPVTLLDITHANVQIVAGRCHLTLMSPRTVMHAVLRLVSGNESNDTCVPVLPRDSSPVPFF